jgi:zinc transport system substrate-binding protein
MIVISGHSIHVRRFVACLAIAALLATTGCVNDATRGDGDRLRVVAAFYPLQFLAERIGGDRVTVTNLVEPGAEPHDLELEPRQVGALADADLVVYLAGFQPAVDEAVEESVSGHVNRDAKDRVFDVAGVQPLDDRASGEDDGNHLAMDNPHGSDTHADEGKDPHVWLDPTRFAAIGDQLADRLATADPDHADGFRARARALRADLTALDQEFSAALATCQRHEIVTSHAAFGYLAARYHLVQVPISGLSPEEEPTPQRIAEVAGLARAGGTTTIFFETLVSPKLAETLAREVGARAEVLDPIEGLEPGSGGDYLSVMRANLARLRPALGCT